MLGFLDSETFPVSAADLGLDLCVCVGGHWVASVLWVPTEELTLWLYFRSCTGHHGVSLSPSGCM